MKTVNTNSILRNISKLIRPTTVFIIMIFVLLSNTISAQTSTLWSEDWEGNWTANWHADNGLWQIGTPIGGPDGAFESMTSAGTVIDGYYPNYSNSRLIRHTPFIVPQANENPRLRFWHWYEIGAADIGTVQIKISGADWETISPNYYSYGNYWTYSYIDLTPYAGDTVEICFLFTADNLYNNWGWYGLYFQYRCYV